ncbi:Fc.00g111680.m01.CDS01 [Cosmosporella sp. VM-42]
MADDHEGSSADMARLELEDKIVEKAQKGRSDRGAGGRGRGGRFGGQGREVQVSKALSRLLRHQAENAGIQLDNEGFAPLDRVLAWGPLKSLQVTFADVQATVTSSDKQRFSMKLNPSANPALSTASTEPSDYLIRANQGHSIKVESSSLLVPITLEEGNIPPTVLHGTYFYFWPKIVDSGGLKPMSRNHVHCSTGTPEDGVVSGMRGDAEMIVEIDVEGSLREGLKWWKSENGVLLTEGDELGVLSTRFFKKVTGRKVDIGVLWKDGEWVADLPSGIKGRVPFGKGPRGGGRGGRGGRRGGS